METEKCYYHTFFEFQIALWLAKFINLYIKSGLFIEVASEQSSLYVDSLPLKATLSKNDTINLQTNNYTETAVFRGSYCSLWIYYNCLQISMWPMCGQCSHFLHSENTRKAKVFWCFQGVKNGNIGYKWVNGDCFTYFSLKHEIKVYLR